MHHLTITLEFLVTSTTCEYNCVSMNHTKNDSAFNLSCDKILTQPKLETKPEMLPQPKFPETVRAWRAKPK